MEHPKCDAVFFHSCPRIREATARKNPRFRPFDLVANFTRADCAEGATPSGVAPMARHRRPETFRPSGRNTEGDVDRKFRRRARREPSSRLPLSSRPEQLGSERSGPEQPGRESVFPPVRLQSESNRISLASRRSSDPTRDPNDRFPRNVRKTTRTRRMRNPVLVPAVRSGRERNPQREDGQPSYMTFIFFVRETARKPIHGRHSHASRAFTCIHLFPGSVRFRLRSLERIRPLDVSGFPIAETRRCRIAVRTRRRVDARSRFDRARSIRLSRPSS